MRKEHIFYWMPRILAIGGIIFLALFALDVFVPGRSFLESLRGFFVHLIPNYLLAMVLLIAWKKEQIGGLLFLLLGVFFTFFLGRIGCLDLFYLYHFQFF